MSSVNDLLKVRPTPLHEVIVEVQFDGNKSPGALVFQDYVTEVAYRCQAYRGETRPGKLGVTYEDVEYYLNGLVYLRVHHVRKTLPEDLREWYEYEWVVPALLSLILKQVGRAVDSDLGVTLLPVTNLEQPDPYRMQKVAQALKAAHARFGLMVGVELPRDRRGSFEFMATSVINNEVCAHSTSTHPTTAFLAAVSANHVLQDIFAPRVSYGSTAFFRQFLSDNVVDELSKSNDRANRQFKDSGARPNQQGKPDGGGHNKGPKDPRRTGENARNRESSSETSNDKTFPVLD